MLAALLCGCGGPRYSSTRGASLERFKLHSTLLHRTLTEILVRPAAAAGARCSSSCTDVAQGRTEC